MGPQVRRGAVLEMRGSSEEVRSRSPLQPNKQRRMRLPKGEGGGGGTRPGDLVWGVAEKPMRRPGMGATAVEYDG